MKQWIADNFALVIIGALMSAIGSLAMILIALCTWWLAHTADKVEQFETELRATNVQLVEARRDLDEARRAIEAQARRRLEGE